MDLRNLFSKISFDNKSKEQPTKKDAPAHWIKCPECNALMFFKEVENQENTCPKCNFHMRIGGQVGQSDYPWEKLDELDKFESIK